MATRRRYVLVGDLARVTYEDVLDLWKNLLGVYGLPTLAHLGQFGHENIREVLMKLAIVWSDNPLNLDSVLETVLILTCWHCMTQTCQFDGEGILEEPGTFRLRCWMDRSHIFLAPSPQPSTPLRIKLAPFVATSDMKDRLLKELGLALEQLETLCGLAGKHPQLLGRFQVCNSLLDDVQAAVTSMAVAN